MDVNLLKKEILFRSSRRGMKELDIIIGSFVDTHIDTLNNDELSDLKKLLLAYEPDLWDWLSSGKAPKGYNTPIFIKICQSMASC